MQVTPCLLLITMNYHVCFFSTGFSYFYWSYLLAGFLCFSNNLVEGRIFCPNNSGFNSAA